MSTLQDILYYVLSRYPNATDLSNARVTKMVYLADWKHALTYGSQMTDIRWRFDNFGPFVWDVKDAAGDNPELFSVAHAVNAYGSSKVHLSVKTRDYKPSLTTEEKMTLRHVFDQTKDMTYRQFIDFVYSTYPIVASRRYRQLDLVALAGQYKKLLTPRP